MFGVMLKNNEKSFERIQAFRQEIEDDEATASKSRHEIEGCRKTYTKSYSTLDDLQMLLMHQKHLTGSKTSEKNGLQAKFDEASRSVNEIHVEYAVITDRRARLYCSVDFLQCELSTFSQNSRINLLILPVKLKSSRVI
jgi:chromosome segregation ATPase